MQIVVTEPQLMADEAKATLAAIGEVRYGPFDDTALDVALAECEVLMVRLGRHIDAGLLTKAPSLRFLVTATTGLDHIDQAAAEARGIRVISLRDCPNAIRDVSATAEHTLGLLLSLIRQVPAASAYVNDGGWNRDLFWGTQLRSKRLGIIGYGRIGAMVAGYCAALGMEVVACDQEPAKIVAPATQLPLPDVIASSDVVSIHATASSANRHLVDRALIDRMKPGAILVNTARGMLVDEDALADALISERIGGVAVDVLAGEVKGDVESSPLLRCARSGHNIIITPHIGGATREAIARTEGAVTACLARALQTGSQ